MYLPIREDFNDFICTPAVVAVYMMVPGTFCVPGMPPEPKSTTVDGATGAAPRFLKAVLASHPRRGGVREAHSRLCAPAAGRPSHTAQSWRL